MPLITPHTPTNPTSGGASLSARSVLEEQYAERLERELTGFVQDVHRDAQAARAEGRVLTLAAVLVLWGAMLSRTESWLPASSSLNIALRESDLPAQAAAAVQQASNVSTALGETAATALSRLRTALGLARTPMPEVGGEFGRLITASTPEGTSVASQSWQALGEKWARTAATADAADSMIQLLRDEGYTHKRWMTRYDSKVRPEHHAADRETIPLEESFIVGGSALRFPGDPLGDIAMTANCRCVLVGVRFGRHERDLPEGEEPWNNPRPA